jgi:hypothetical protein
MVSLWMMSEQLPKRLARPQEPLECSAPHLVAARQRQPEMPRMNYRASFSLLAWQAFIDCVRSNPVLNATYAESICLRLFRSTGAHLTKLGGDACVKCNTF